MYTILNYKTIVTILLILLSVNNCFANNSTNEDEAKQSLDELNANSTKEDNSRNEDKAKQSLDELNANSTKEDKSRNEDSAKQFLVELNANATKIYNFLTLANWNYETDLTEANKKAMLTAKAKAEEIELALHSELKKFDYKTFQDENIRRQFQKLIILGTAALDRKDSEKLASLVAEMSSIYASAKVVGRDKRKLSLEPELTEIMANERDYDLLKEVWVNWRDATGKKVRNMFSEFVELGNKMAVKNSFDTIEFRDLGDYWLYAYEDNDFKAKIEKLWTELEPFYKQLHAFVRMKLKKKYGDKMPTDNTIPAHLLGNMWAQSWTNIFNDVTPFPELHPLDVTLTMKNQSYDPKRMFEVAEEFFVGLGLDKMTEEFWNNSMIVKPDDREVICHASAWDMGTGSDFRIKMCTEVNMENLITIHHEMGHIEYNMLYKDLPLVYRDGANPGFHEALGDLMALSVLTPKHLQKQGLLDNYTEDNDGLLNFQLKMALDKVAFLPFGYLIDLWRWDVFSKNTSSDEYTKKWWELRLKYQGISPPVPRTENDFDPGSKFHVVANVPYIRYFVSFIIQFQFHKALCELANQPELYNCDIAGNKDVGNKIREVFSQGSSTSWQTQLQQLTKSSEMSAQPLLEYFKPLREFLEQELANETIGWTADVDTYVSKTNSAMATKSQVFVSFITLVVTLTFSYF